MFSSCNFKRKFNHAFCILVSTTALLIFSFIFVPTDLFAASDIDANEFDHDMLVAVADFMG